MPIKHYRCTFCLWKSDEVFGPLDDPPTGCDECGGEVVEVGVYQLGGRYRYNDKGSNDGRKEN